MKIRDLYVYADTSVHAGGLDNGKIMVNGVQVGSTHDLVEGDGSAIAYGSATDFSLGSSLILPAGQTTKIDVYADAKTSTSTNLSNNETVTIYVSAGSSNAQGISSLTAASVPASNTGGNQITISSSSLASTKYSGYGNQTLIAGANNAKIGAFTLSTGATEGVTVNTIAISMTTANAASITNLTLKDDATGNVLGNIITTPSGSGTSVTAGENGNSFPVNLAIPVSSTKTISIYANVLSGSNAGPIITYVDTGTTGTGGTTGISASVADLVTLQTMTLGDGSLSLTAGAGDPVSNNVLAGASSVHVGQFTFAAANSAYTVQNLAILIPNGAATSVTNVTLSYKDVNGATQTATQPLSITTPATNAYATATFTGLTMYVPMNDSGNLDVYVGTPTIASGALSGAAIIATLDDGNGSNLFRAVNSAGSSLTKFNANNTNVSSGGTFYVRKSIPTFARVATGLTVPATSQPLYKFSITADSAGAIEWSQLTFDISTSSATLTNLYIVDDSTGAVLLDSSGNNQYASTSGSRATTTLRYNGTAAQYAQVAAGATKTYALYGTVASLSSNRSVIISLAPDSATVAAASAINTVQANRTVWSDRSASSHTVATSDWTNGYLLKNFTSSATSYSW